MYVILSHGNAYTMNFFHIFRILLCLLDIHIRKSFGLHYWIKNVSKIELFLVFVLRVSTAHAGSA